MRPRTFSTLLAVLSLAGALSGCSFYSGHTASVKMQQHAEHIADAGLLIDNRNGKVEVTADAVLTQVEIDATLTCGGDTKKEADERIKSANFSVERDAASTLVIKPSFPQPTHASDGASFIVRLPGARHATVKSSNGSVKVTGLAGELKVNTSNGGVTVNSHDGPATIATSNGFINITALKGSLNAKSSNGSVHATDIAGPVGVSTSNGRVEVRLVNSQSGPLNLDTSNGGVKVTVGAMFNGMFKLDTSNGRIKITDTAGRVTSSEIEGSDGTVTVGEGGTTSVIDSSNGSIEITIEP